MAIETAHEEISDPDQSPRERKTLMGFDATRIFKVAWSDREAFVQEVLGDISQLQAPVVYPHFNSTAYAQECAISPWPGSKNLTSSGTVTSYDWAKIVVSYGSGNERVVTLSNGDDDPESGAKKDTRYTENFEDRSEFLTLPSDELTWDEAGTESLTDIEAPAKLLPMTEWIITYENVDDLPTNLDDFVGKVNSLNHKSFSRETIYVPETLLALAITTDVVVNTSGDQKQRLTRRHAYKRQGWNKFYKRGVVQPQKIYKSGVEFKPYETIDFKGMVPQ